MNPPIPVLCDQCRAAGQAGEAPFADLADLLAFVPVERRSHINGWDGERQRAFIAALVVTGSPRRAARAIGKHAFGAEQLRRARGGSSFAAAWDAAVELSRERELAGLHQGLTELAAEQEAETARRRGAILPAEQRRVLPAEAPRRNRRHHRDDDEEDEAAEDKTVTVRREVESIRSRLTNARRCYLMTIAADPKRRAAWEVLVGPTDWGEARRGQPQADEPSGAEHWAMRSPDILLPLEAGFLAEATGGPDATAALAEAVAAARAGLLANGWTPDATGTLCPPDAPAAPPAAPAKSRVRSARAPTPRTKKPRPRKAAR